MEGDLCGSVEASTDFVSARRSALDGRSEWCGAGRISAWQARRLGSSFPSHPSAPSLSSSPLTRRSRSRESRRTREQSISFFGFRCHPSPFIFFSSMAAPAPWCVTDVVCELHALLIPHFRPASLHFFLLTRYYFLCVLIFFLFHSSSLP
ncbi:hypothetical protein B0H11DRAFT_2000210 [Mycena galericulata]|nr:hypothetical protein B0H11DRAFT_2000210 [Mycena galericulata]